jgi:hypothetical protein
MEIKDLTPKINIANKVRNTRLPRTKSLMPLFETISNAIHAIKEAKDNDLISDNGTIKIKLIRNGEAKTLRQLKDVNLYPINGIEIIDNGIGLNDENLLSFIEADTDHKLTIGGKGVGRFVCLKVFQHLEVNSLFLQNGECLLRSFHYCSTKEGIRNYNESKELAKQKHGTSIKLVGIKQEYQNYTPSDILELARQIIVHFQLYFLQERIPKIILENQNNEQVDLGRIYKNEFKKEIQESSFTVGEHEFNLYLSKSGSALSHKIHFCAHNRTVKEEGLCNRIIDLGKYSIKTETDSFYYQAFVVGEFLNDNVDLERVGFDFPNGAEDDEDDDSDGITLSKIRNAALLCIEDLLSEYLENVRTKKIEEYRPIIYDELPQYRSILQVKESIVRMIKPNLSKEKLDIELYKIQAKWRLEVKEKGDLLVNEKKDITNLDEYKLKYDQYLSEFNEIGKSDLAIYVIHRKAVLDLFNNLLSINEDNKFSNEDIIHSLFFPIKSSSDEVPYEKQNLWLLDERLCYHSFLASDKAFEKMGNVNVNENQEDRPDLLIFNDAIAFTEDSDSPYNSFTIVEFKKPQRKNYKDNSSSSNPLDQVERYITNLLNGKVTNRIGRQIRIDKSTPFYVYIVCDIDDSFESILHNREFKKTPDGMGYFKFKSEYYSAYIEVLPFEKVLNDSKKRNRILFEKLGLKI